MDQPPRRAAIRPATLADVPALGRLGALLVELHHELDAERFLPATSDTEAAYARFLGRQLERPEVVILVADEGSRAVGYAYAGLEGSDYMALRGPAGVVYDLLVDAACRGRGVGRELLEAAVAALVAKGAPRIVLSTAQANETAQRLFASAGFRPTMVEMTRETDPPGDGPDASRPWAPQR